MVKRPEPFK